MRKTIVICGHSLTAGGLQRATGMTSLALAELGYDPVLVLQETAPADFAYAGRLLPADSALPEVREAFSRAQLIIDYNWNNFTPGEYRAVLHDYLLKHHAGRLVPTAHNTFTIGSYLDYYHQSGLLHRLPAIVCVSEAVRTAAETRYGSLPNARVLHNVIAPEFTRQAHSFDANPHTRPYFLFVGRNKNINHKGLDYLIKAWSTSGLADTHDLVLLGDQEITPALVAIIEHEGVSSSVHHQPFTSTPYAWMRHAEAVVLASRHEGLGLVLPEALALGTPCIATRCGGPEEVIQDGVNGFLLDVGDTQGFAAAMVRMSRDKGLRERLSANAPASVQQFLFPAHVRAWEQLLTDLNIRKNRAEVRDPAPAVSVQLPIFNKVRYLCDCLDSIAAQTMTDFEVVCVDDGSTDGSWEIVQSYAKRDPRFRVFRHKTNLGTIAARKRCFQEARGEYMAFADADDTAHPEWLDKLLETARREKADFVQCAADVGNDEQCLPDEVHKQYLKSFSAIPPTTLENENVFKGCGWPIKTNLWISLVARSVYRAILPHIPDELVPHGNDGILIFMMTFFAKKFVSIPDRLYCYRANGTSANLVIPEPEVVLGHIRSRSRIIRIAKDFLSRVSPGRSVEQTPIGRLEQSCRVYSQVLMQRCLTRRPEARQTLERAFAEHFPLTVVAGAIAIKAPVPPVPPPPKPSILGRLRAMTMRLWVAPRIQRGGLFFPFWYLERNPDVKAAGVDPLTHFLVHGAWEGRNPNPLFDSKWYLSVNPDVAASGMNPLVHYLRHGWREGRSPSRQFNIAEYLRKRPDVAKAGIEPLGHFFLHGVAEGVQLSVLQPAVPQKAVAAMPKQQQKTSSISPANAAITSPSQPTAPAPKKKLEEVPSSTPPKAKVDSLPRPVEPLREAAKLEIPHLKLSTVQELKNWHALYPDFIALREKMLGISEKDYLNSNPKLIQDLAMVGFMTKNLRPGAKVLEIGGGDSRVLTYFKDRFECWDLDKFEGIGNGLKKIPNAPYKIVPEYIGAFSKDLPSGYFDLVYSISVFEHVQGDAAALDAVIDDIDRLLKHDGLQVHCMDCRFSPNGPLDLPKQRPLINHVITRHGFTAQYIYDHYRDPEVFTMSGQAYDRYWKKACNNRPHELDGLPFNIFLVAGRSSPARTLLPEKKSVRNIALTASAAVMGESGSDSQLAMNSVAKERRCNICGSSTFKPAWAGRLRNGLPPTCTKCLSCERHRVIRRAFEDMPKAWFVNTVLLQFSNDPSVPTGQFGKVEVSVFKGKNHLDLQAIDRPDASYDWAVCNHVLEHVQDDRKAMRELLRIVKPSGGLVFSYPSPRSREKTDDWGWPNEKLAGHYRDYGRDAITTRFAEAFADYHVFSYTNMDPVTETSDICYFATRDLIKSEQLRSCSHWELLYSGKKTERRQHSIVINTKKYEGIPSKLRLEASTICQLKCKTCYMRVNNSGTAAAGFLKFKNFKQLVDENCNYIKSIELANSGEVFLNPELYEIIEYAHSKRIAVSAGSGVNFNTVSDKVLEALVKFQFSRLNLSIDGASQETYSKYRIGGDFERVLLNIKKLIAYKKKYNSRFPELGWQYVLMASTEPDIMKAKEIANELSIPITFKLGWDSGIAFQNPELVKQRTGLKYLTREEYAAGTGEKYLLSTMCGQLFNSPQINWDGRLLGCCAVYQSDFGVNVFEIGLKNALRSPNYVLAKEMITGNAQCPENPINIPCAACPYYKNMLKENRFFKLT